VQADFARKLNQALSAERLEAYRRRAAADDDLNLFCHYVWNIALSESLYPSLQALEVVLRNSIHEAARVHFGRDDWFDDVEIIHHRHEVDALEKARTKLRRERKQPDVGRIIAELNFGFWTSLLDRRYEQVLWPAMIRQAFPHMPRRQRTRVNLVKRFNEVRTLRNRIFHHEPIWYWPLADKHARVLEAIHWIEPAMLELIATVDRFPQVYADGIAPIEAKLRAFC